jgi:hypothetical protein
VAKIYGKRQPLYNSQSKASKRNNFRLAHYITKAAQHSVALVPDKQNHDAMATTSFPTRH